MDSYIICATPRTGSTLLCDLLAATGVAGAPDSFFMRDPGPVWAERWGLPDRAGRSQEEYAAAYLQAAIQAGQGQTGIFGLRLMRKHLGDLRALIDWLHPGLASDRDRLEAAFGRMLYVHLWREDKLAQAVSMVKAEQTGLWHIAPDGSEIERLAPPRAPQYDFARIAAKLAELEAFDTDWQLWFDAQGIAPLRIGYESLAADPAGTAARVCAALGVRRGAEPPAPGVARMADATSREWMRRFRQESGMRSP
jgi:trehalose 2-sulfotransferase